MWQINSTTIITMIINTTQCNFTTTPLYFVALHGTNAIWTMTGHAAIYSPTNQSFQIYSKSVVGGSATILLNYTSTFSWNIIWTGFY